MSKGHPSVPSLRLHKPSGQAVVTLSGRDHYLGPYGTAVSRREYDRRIAEWLAAGRPNRADASELSIIELCLAYWRYAKGYYCLDGKKSGELHPIRAIIKLLKDLYGPTRASEFGPLALKALRLTMIEKGWSRGTINQQVGRIRRMFRWAVSEQLLPVTVYQALLTVEGLRAGRSAAKETEPVRPVADELLQATLPHLPPVVADMVRLQRLTGARPGEICFLRPVDIDQSGDVWVYRPAKHKNSHRGQARLIFLGPSARQLIVPYLANRAPEDFCFSPLESEELRRAGRTALRVTPVGYGNGVGTNRKRRPKRSPGAAYTTASYRRTIARACASAKLPDWSPNQIRHTVATEIRRRFGMESARIILGHSDVETTAIYAERDITLAMTVAAQIG